MSWHDRTTFDASMPQFPAVCPRCRTRTGQPFLVSSAGATARSEVSVRCERCRTEWIETRQPDREHVMPVD
jgi:hypothetical protein